MKPFARINLSSALSSVALAKVDALRRGILVSSLACIQGDNAGALLDPDGKPRTIVAKTDEKVRQEFLSLIK